MGFLDFFAFTDDQKLKSYAKKLRDKDTPGEDRQVAARWLAGHGTPEAIMALLGRFEMTYEHSMKDASEKQEVDELVVELGPKAVEPLQVYLRKCQNFARPLALYERIAGREAALGLLLQIIEAERDRSEFKADKKRNLLIKLAEYKDARAAEIARSFLTDYDEGTRCAAAEVLVAQDETDAIREALQGALARPGEESNRLKHRLKGVAAERGWPIAE